MCKRTILLKAFTGLALLAPLVLSGCGASNPYDYGDPASSGFGYGLSGSSALNSSTGTTTVAYGASPYGTAPDGTVTPVPVASAVTPGTSASVLPSISPSPSPSGSQGLKAEVTHIRNGLIFGLGTCKATVQITNPDTVDETGTLTVTFTQEGKPTSHVQSQAVSLKAGATQTIVFSDKKWSIDGATAAITTDPIITPTSTASSSSTVN
jgi:hypothetical protein